MPRSLVLLLTGLLALFAQQPPPDAAAGPKKDLVISTTTQLVVEDVLIKGKDGKPILGLKPSDFTMTEDGKPQKISVFEFQALEGEAPQTPAAPRPAPRIAAANPAPKSGVRPVTSVEIAPERPGDLLYRDRRLMVMFFDMTSMPIQDQKRAQTAALKFLQTQMKPADLVAIMTFASDVKVVQDFTDDRDLLEQHIRKLIIGEGQGFEISNQDDSASDTGAAFQADDTEFNIFNTDRQLSAIETAVKMLGSLNEKKALVYFASGIQRNGLDNQAQLRSTINAAIRANVALYTVDARGLVAEAPLGDATKGSPGGQAMYSGSSARSRTSNFQNQQETLYTLAADTGGKALLDNNDLSMGITQAQKDMTSYYIIGYYTTNGALDGHFRRIKITLNNSALAHNIAKIDYRPGYYAGKTFDKFNESDKEHQLAEALMLGDPITDMNIAMELNYFRLGRDRYFVPLVVKIPGSEIELARHGGAESTRLDFIGEINDSKGATVANVRDNIQVKLQGETAQQLAKTTLEYDTGFTLAPGNYTAKFLARDNTTGKMGTFESKFVVPDLTVDQKYLPISSVVLSNQRQPLDAAVGAAEKNKKLLAAHPLVQDGVKLIPSVTRVFRKNQELYVFLEAYEPTAQNTQPLMANVSFYRGKAKAFETDPLRVSDGLNPKTKAVPLRFSVPLASLQPGIYNVQVTVLHPAGQKASFWQAPVEVIP